MSEGAADPDPPRRPPRWVPAVPLGGMTAVCLGLGGYLWLVDGSLTTGRLPLAFLFLGLGVISAAGTITLLLWGSPRAVSPGSDAAGTPGPDDETPAARAVPRPDLPEPPRPRPADLPGAPVMAVPDEGRPVPADVAGERDAPSDIGPTDGAEGAPAGPAPGTATGAGGVIECATCRRVLPEREAWRQCRSCGRSLCVNCLTESVRAFGSGYCRCCSGASL